MDKETLAAKKQAAAQRFDELQTQGEQKRKELEEIEDELKRLQGEYRAYDTLVAAVEEPKKEAKPAKASPAPNVIDVEPTLSKEAKNG